MDDISDDVLLNIFSFLDKKQLCAVTRVSKRWARVSCDQSLWRELNLKRLKIANNNAVLSRLISTRLASLRRVHLGSVNISFSNLKALWMKCKNLEAVVFGRNSRLIKRSKRRSVRIPPRVKTLDLRQVKGKFEFLLASGIRFRNVENLGLGRGSYSPILFPHLFCQATSLKILDLTNCDLLVDDLIEDIFTRCINVESLCLIGCRKLTGTFFPSMIQHCGKLRTLLVRYLPITDDVLCSCEWQKLPLQELDISACPDMTSIGLCALVSKLRCIRYLNMSYCGIGHAVNDSVLNTLISYGVAEKLKMLDVRWSFFVSASTLRVFLTQCKQMEYLGVYQSNGVTSSTISEVVCHLQKLQTIEFGGLKQEVHTTSQLLRHLRIHCKNLSTLSLINFGSIDHDCDQEKFEDFLLHAKSLVRINLCDCSEELVSAARTAALSSSVSLTEKWECALPPPCYTLDSVTRNIEYC